MGTQRYRRLHDVTIHVAGIEKERQAAIERFDASLDRRTCGHVQPGKPPAPRRP